MVNDSSRSPLPGKSPLRVMIASRNLPESTGGLAAYQRGLAIELSHRANMDVRLIAAWGGDGAEPGIQEPLPVPAQVLNCRCNRTAWMSMASRPLFHPLLKRGIAAAFRKSVANKKGMDVSAISNPDVIHFVGTGWDFAGFGFCELARNAGARFTVWPATHPGQWGDDVIDLALYHLADAVFCQSQSEINHLADRGLPLNKAVLCGLPPMCRPDGNGREFRSKWNLGTRPIVLFVGRRDEGKGLPVLLQGWKSVLVKNPEAVLVIAGTGDIRSTDLSSDSFIDLGVADERTKASALAACDIFCLPSAHESFGIVFAEAWSYGKPVICGPAPASREWIQDGETGLHSDQAPPAVAAAINRLLGDSELRLRMGEAGRAFQQATLTWDAVAAIHARAFAPENGY